MQLSTADGPQSTANSTELQSIFSLVSWVKDWRFMNSILKNSNKKAPSIRGFENKLLSTVDCQTLTVLQVFELFHNLFRNPGKGIASIVEKILHGHHSGQVGKQTHDIICASIRRRIP
jgi:hypothetical protein